MGGSLAEQLSGEVLNTDAKNTDLDLKDEVLNENGLMRPYDPKTHLEYVAIKKLEIKQQNEELERSLRKDNALKAFRFSSIWAVFIGTIIILHGFGRCYGFFDLTQTEFIFILGTLTTGIFAFYTLVLKYLFYRKRRLVEKKSNN